MIRTAMVALLQSVAECGKPFITKIADVGFPGMVYFFVLLFHVVSYIVIAFRTRREQLILYVAGYAGLQPLMQVIIADMTTLEWRALTSSLIWLPYVVNAFVGANINALIS
ncbi:hypothetical protein D9619_005144 [Psilocybe cf. subviscida]|uniref:Uncharacterized protein n=1 Tax=Psilocybe cf. subviscida TaxID=2480587 RepID=A0A8H5BQS2_9AGAR|nr:hypothetical protein D9619_005144 [Psilocybe cf. subviscida]